MTGKQLFDKYTSKRDYTGSTEDEYAQLLLTIMFALPDKIYTLLEQAKTQNKKLSIITKDTDSFAPELTIDSIILV